VSQVRSGVLFCFFYFTAWCATMDIETVPLRTNSGLMSALPRSHHGLPCRGAAVLIPMTCLTVWSGSAYGMLPVPCVTKKGAAEDLLDGMGWCSGPVFGEICVGEDRRQPRWAAMRAVLISKETEASDAVVAYPKTTLE
jgi:hypothetical protein